MNQVLTTDFVSCLECGQTFPAYRSLTCPHPIPRNIPSLKLIAASSVADAKDADGYPVGIGEIDVSTDTRIAVIPKPPRKRKGKPSGPHVLEGVYYQRQSWEKVGQGGKRWTAFSYWMELGDAERTYVKVAKDLGYSAPTLIEQWAKQDKWPLRLEAYLNDQAKAEQIAIKKRWNKRTKQALTLLDSGLELLGTEYLARFRELKKAVAGNITTETLLKYTIELGKMVELLQGRATEHVTHDTPAMIHERKFRDALRGAQDMLQDLLTANPDASDEDAERFRDQAVSFASELSQVDRGELAAAIGGKIDQTSNAEN